MNRNSFPIVFRRRGSYLVYDTFTDDDAVILPDHTPNVDVEGGGWSEEVGSWAIIGNKAYVDTKVAQSEFAVIDAGEADCTIEVAITMTDDGAAIDHNVGLCFRYSATNDWWIFFFDIGGANADNLILGKYVTGVWTEVDKDAFVWNIGETKIMKIVMEGDDISCYIDDVLITSTTDAHNNTDAKHGLFNNNTITQRWDEFKIS